MKSIIEKDFSVESIELDYYTGAYSIYGVDEEDDAVNMTFDGYLRSDEEMQLANFNPGMKVKVYLRKLEPEDNPADLSEFNDKKVLFSNIFLINNFNRVEQNNFIGGVGEEEEEEETDSEQNDSNYFSFSLLEFNYETGKAYPENEEDDLQAYFRIDLPFDIAKTIDSVSWYLLVVTV